MLRMDDDMTLPSAMVVSDDKHYFFAMVSAVAQKLEALPVDSPIRMSFSESRLEAIRQRIESTSGKELEWAYWQPLFLFMRNRPQEAIVALDHDLQLVVGRGDKSAARFLGDERDRDGDGPWRASLFEVFAKARLCNSDLLSLEGLDWRLSNGKNVDARVKIDQRAMNVECMTRGESDAGKDRWQAHCDSLTENPDAPYFERQDAYTAGRMLYGAVYNKLAPDYDSGKSQFAPDEPNILLISLSSTISDVRADTPSISWALDELFNDQPNGGTGPMSLQAFLLLDAERRASFQDLISVPKRISGVLMFDGCALKHARINYNAYDACRISHRDMALLEQVLSQPPPYWP